MTLDQYLGALVKKGMITISEGMARATNLREFNAFLEDRAPAGRQ